MELSASSLKPKVVATVVATQEEKGETQDARPGTQDCKKWKGFLRARHPVRA